MSRRSLVAFAVLAAVPAAAFAFSAGPPEDRVKLCAPLAARGACTQCHQASQPLASSTITLSMDGVQVLPRPSCPPTRVQALPNHTYQFILSVVEPQANTRCQHPATTLGCGNPVPPNFCAFGFEMAAVHFASCASTPAQSGCFTATPGVTQLKCTSIPGPNGCPTCNTGVQFIEHVCGSTVGSAADRHSWTFDWTSPPTGAANWPVHVYFAVNSTNASGNNQGDMPHFSTDPSPTDPSCMPLDLVLEEQVVAAGCDLRRASVASITPPIDKAGTLFSDTTTCPGACPGTCVPASVLVTNFSAPAPQDVDSSSGDPLVVYSVVNPTGCATCPGSINNPGILYLVKGTGRVLATYQ